MGILQDGAMQAAVEDVLARIRRKREALEGKPHPPSPTVVLSELETEIEQEVLRSIKSGWY